MPKNKKPRKKYSKPKPKARYHPLEAHQHCPAEVRYMDKDSTSPHKAYLYCTLHQKHVMWLSAEMAPRWAEALATTPGISSNG